MTEERQVVECPSCGARLRLKSSATMPERFKVRCSSCSKPFVVRRKASDRGTQPLVAISSPSGMSQETVASRPASSSGLSPRPEQLRTIADRKTFEVDEVVAGRYQIVRFIDQGGMGEVYEAQDSALGQRVALKTIRPTVAADAEALARFKREVHVARQVTHHNVCRIYDLGTHRSTSPIGALYPGGEILFVTMELLRGETLSQRLDRTGAMAPEVGRPIAEQMATALDAAHAAGVVHRDFKSANVFLESSGPGRDRVVVTDFGLARAEESDGLGGSLTIAGSVLGSPAYMAPEQVEGGKVTGAADIYALGVVLYEMCTGQVPFRGETPLATAVKRLTENPPSPRELEPGLDASWERAILNCLERHPENRPLSGAKLLDILTGQDVRREARAARNLPTPRRVITLVLAVILVVAAVVVNFREWTGIGKETAELSYLQPPAVSRPAVAVVGFRNVTGNEDHAWLSTGLAEMLMSELASGQGLRLIPGENVSQARRELDLKDGDTYSAETLKTLRDTLGSDFLVSGGYTVVGGDSGDQLRVDIRLQDTALSENSTAFVVTGDSTEIFTLVADAGSQLREALGADDGEGPEVMTTFRTASPESTKLYSLGLERLHANDPVEAVDFLERAEALDSRNPKVKAALAEALQALGYVSRAQDEAKLAMELSSSLSATVRLEIEGLYRQLSQDWLAAVSVFDQLWRASPDDLEYGLSLAEALIAEGEVEKSLEVARVLERLPSAAAGDVRILFVRARAAAAHGNFKVQEQEAAKAAELSGQRGARLQRAQALLIQGDALRNLGEVDRAQGVTTEAEGLFQQLGDLPRVGRARVQRGMLLYLSGDLISARRVFEQGVETYQRLGDKGGLAQVLNSLAVVLKKQGENVRARDMYQESLALSTETNNRVGMANSEINLGLMDRRSGDLSGALKRFGRALVWSQDLGDQNQTASSFHNMAVTQRQMGLIQDAAENQEKALELQQRIGQRAGEGYSRLGLGHIETFRGAPEAAAKHYSAALSIAEEIRSRSLEAYAREGLGRTHYEALAPQDAKRELEAALTVREDLGERDTLAGNRIALARLAVDGGDFAEAESQARQAGDLATGLGASDLKALADALRARSLVYLGRQGEARSLVGRAMLHAEKSEDLWIRLEIQLSAARVVAASDRISEAREILQAALLDASVAELVPLRLEALLLDSRLLESQGRGRGAQEGIIEVIDEAERRGLSRLKERGHEASSLLGS